MKQIALILVTLLLLAALASCSTGVGGGTTAGAIHGGTDEPTEEGGTTAEPSEPGGDTDPTEPTGTTVGNGGASVPETEDPETTEAETDEEATLLKLTAKGETVTLRAVYYWEGDLGTSIGGEATLANYADSLPMLSYGEDLSAAAGKSGEIVHVKVYGSDLEKREAASGADLTGLSTLGSGLYYVIVGVVWQDGGAHGYEFACALAVGLPLYVRDGSKLITPEAIPVMTESYDAASDEWTVETSKKSLADAKDKAPSVTLSDALTLTLIDAHAETSVMVYDGEMYPSSLSVNDFSELYTNLRPGTWYVVVRVTWTHGYVEAHDRYVTETVDYVLKVVVPEM